MSIDVFCHFYHSPLLLKKFETVVFDLAASYDEFQMAISVLAYCQLAQPETGIDD